jgi:hypothetical protein
VRADRRPDIRLVSKSSTMRSSGEGQLGTIRPLCGELKVIARCTHQSSAKSYSPQRRRTIAWTLSQHSALNFSPSRVVDASQSSGRRPPDRNAQNMAALGRLLVQLCNGHGLQFGRRFFRSLGQAGNSQRLHAGPVSNTKRAPAERSPPYIEDKVGLSAQKEAPAEADAPRISQNQNGLHLFR